MKSISTNMLQPEQILSNWEEFLGYIDMYIMGDRGIKLKAFYEQYSERFMMMPAAHKPQYHNCFPGGYVDHVNRVVQGALKIDRVWREMDVIDTYTTEELVFSALNHDLGKFGTFEQEAYLPQTDQWRREKLNEPYMFNDRLEFMSVPDRGLYILSQLGIIGYLIFLTFISYFLIRGFFNYQKYKNLLHLSALIFIFTTIFLPLPSGSFFTTYGAIIFWTNVGLVLAFEKKKISFI